MSWKERLSLVGLGIFVFVIGFMVYQIIKQQVVQPAQQAADCMPEQVITDQLSFVLAWGFIEQQGGTPVFDEQTGAMSPESDLQGSIWVHQDGELILGVVTKTHLVDVRVTCWRTDDFPDYEIIRTRER